MGDGVDLKMEFSSILLRSVEEMLMTSWPELGAGQETAEGSGSTASPWGGCGAGAEPAVQLGALKPHLNAEQCTWGSIHKCISVWWLLQDCRTLSNLL